MSEKKTKPKYNMLQNTWWMVKLGFQYIWQVPISLLFAVAVAVALNLTELWIAPVILKHVESGVPLGTLLQTILLFALALAR